MAIVKGSPMLADDILRLNFLPVGTILMFDGNGWADDNTIPGWVKCDGQPKTVRKQDGSTISVTPPDLTNKFIKGSATSYNGSTANGTGGAVGHQVTIGADNLPAHTHAIGSHTHSVTGTISDTTNLLGSWYEDSNTECYNKIAKGAECDSKSAGGSGTGVLLTINMNHNHTLSNGNAAAATSGNTGNNTTTAAAKLTIEPRSYMVIFIRKCA